MTRYVEKITAKGKDYYYFKCRNHRERLPGRPGSSEFEGRYKELMGTIKPMRTRDQPTKDIQGYVYFLRIDDLLKIGFSTHPPGRIRDISPLRKNKIAFFAFIPGTYMDEQRLHYQLRDCRRDGEWFAATSQVMALIARVVLFGTEQE